MLAILVVTTVAINANGHFRSSLRRGLGRDRDLLALTAGWSILPTAVLAIASFAHPIYSVRYVSASAPGVALLAAFVVVRAFPGLFGARADLQSSPTSPRRSLRVVLVAGAVGLLAYGYVGAISGLQEDLETPAKYLAEHARAGDAVALPDHALTTAVNYYLARDHRLIPLWPQLGVQQRYIEGFDLVLHPSGSAPRRVWVVADGSVAVSRFQKALVQDGYLPRNYIQFNGSALLLYDSSLPVGTVLVPSDGAVLKGTSASLDATWRSNGSAITKVQFVLSGGSSSKVVIGTAAQTRVGFFLSWDTTTVPDGTYSLQSRATDVAGRTSDTPAVTIRVEN